MSVRKRILIVSRYSGDVERNVKVVTNLCSVVAHMGHAPFASHLFCPKFLDDLDPSEREAGMEIGLAWMSVCDEVWVWVQDKELFLSKGMVHDIDAAHALHKPVFAWSYIGRIPWKEWKA